VRQQRRAAAATTTTRGQLFVNKLASLARLDFKIWRLFGRASPPVRSLAPRARGALDLASHFARAESLEARNLSCERARAFALSLAADWATDRPASPPLGQPTATGQQWAKVPPPFAMIIEGGRKCAGSKQGPAGPLAGWLAGHSGRPLMSRVRGAAGPASKPCANPQPLAPQLASDCSGRRNWRAWFGAGGSDLLGQVGCF